MSSNVRLQLDERGEVARPLDPGDVGVAADGAGRAARRVQEHGVERRRVEGERVGDHDLRSEAQAREIGGKQLEPLRRAIDRRQISPRRGQFGGFSPGRGAEVDDAHAGAGPKEPRRQRRCGVLHPPFAVPIALKLDDRRMRVEAHRAGRQDNSAEPLRPTGGVALDAEVERRLRAMRRGYGAGDALAIGRAPALGEPGGRIVVERIGTGENLVAIARDCAQHRIGERGEWGAGRLGARRP